MAIAVVWVEENMIKCAADTRSVPGNLSQTAFVKKIYEIPVNVSSRKIVVRGRKFQQAFSTSYGFVYEGCETTASITALFASKHLRAIKWSESDARSVPSFESLSNEIRLAAENFIKSYGRLGRDGRFTAAFFGWCPWKKKYQVAHFFVKEVAGILTVELDFPRRPRVGKPWLVLGSAAQTFLTTLKAYPKVTLNNPRDAIDKMIAEGMDKNLGAATSFVRGCCCGIQGTRLDIILPRVKPVSSKILHGMDLDPMEGLLRSSAFL